MAVLETPLMDEVRKSGFDEVESIIHLFIGGSELHGAKVGVTDDLDLYGVFLEEPAKALGLEPRSHLCGRLRPMIDAMGLTMWI